MRLAATATAALLLLIATPSNVPAPAQDLGRVLGPLNSVLRGAVRVRPYSYRSRARYARRPGASRAAIAQARAAQIAQARGAQMAQLGALAQPAAFWPGASQDVFDYVLTPREDGLWAHGYGAVVVSMFAQPPRKAIVAAGEQTAQAEQTVGAASSEVPPVCDEDRASHAEAIADWIRDTLALPGDHRPLPELRSALLRAENEITAACPRDIPATLPERVRTMQDRLWALRVAVTNLRGTLREFDAELTSEQKAKLDPPPAAQESRSKRRAPADMAGKLCYVQAQRAQQWPAGEIARAVRPNREQQERLAALSETSSKMGMMTMGACPKEPPATPEGRLNAALDWLDNMMLATATVAVAVDDFYRSLSDEQKAKLDTLSL